uniref:Uncharacterized protein n=1 Tax=Anguilla anguilla TaxID=7936 RepID=A0A0E9S7B7_ANGAN
MCLSSADPLKGKRLLRTYGFIRRLTQQNSRALQSRTE